MNFFGNQNRAFQDYANNTRNQAQMFDPYIQRGNQAGDQAFDYYQMLAGNPNALQDQISSGFEMSPYQQKMLGMNEQRMNTNAANTGMLRSPSAQRALNRV